MQQIELGIYLANQPTLLDMVSLVQLPYLIDPEVFHHRAGNYLAKVCIVPEELGCESDNVVLSSFDVLLCESQGSDARVELVEKGLEAYDVGHQLWVRHTRFSRAEG